VEMKSSQKQYHNLGVNQSGGYAKTIKKNETINCNAVNCDRETEVLSSGFCAFWHMAAK
jgi:hypothetical protein